MSIISAKIACAGMAGGSQKKTPHENRLPSCGAKIIRFFKRSCLCPVDRIEHAEHRCDVDVGVNADAEDVLAVGLLQLDVGHRLCVGALGNRVLAVASELVAVQTDLLERVEERVDGAVARALELDLAFAVDLQAALEVDVISAVLALLVDFAAGELELGGAVEVVFLEHLKQLSGNQLSAERLALCLHQGGKFGVHPFGHVVAEVVAHHESCAALARLRVDADDRLVLSADVGGVDREIGDLPVFGAAFAHVAIALVDGVLMRAGEGGEYQLADIRLTRVDLHVGAALIDVAQMRQVAEIELRVDALRIHIESHRYDVHVARALAVAEESSLHTLGTCQQCQLACRHAAAAVVVGVNADDCRLAVFQVADEVFNLVGIGVGRAHLHRVGQVEDHGILLGGAELLHHAVTDHDGVVGLGAAEALGRILKADIGVARIFVGQLPDQACALNGDIGHTLHIGLKDDLSLEGGGGVVEMHDDVFGALDGFKGLLDQVLARLHQNLNGHVVGNVVVLDQFAANFVLGFRRAGKADLDFLKAHIHQRMEELELFRKVHRVDQRLIAVAQIDAAPDRRLGDGVVRPPAVRQVDLLERNVLLIRRFHENNLQINCHKKSPLNTTKLQ